VIKDLGGLMKQAQEMQARMAELQEKLAAAEIEGSAAGGMVKVVLNGKHEMRDLEIDPSLLVPDEREVLEDLIKAAYNDARFRVEHYAQDEMQKLTGGLNLPPGMFPGT
jgi:DNA-binding YbaB/EbfC family protein